ncbi:MAG: AAA family ATPase [Patescibacteria group bacterium]|nr:AAA family ATPase [Patescibacteria group bacterium]
MIIGITGTNGSGKDTVAQLMVEKLGWMHLSLSNEVREVAQERGVSSTRSNLISLANDLRKEFGSGYFAKRVLGKVKNSFIATSIRNPEEVKVFHEFGQFKLISVDAPIKIRFGRIKNSETRAGAKVGEQWMTFEEFRANEAKEMKGGLYSQQLAKLIDTADIKLENNGTIEELEKKVAELLISLNLSNT